MNYLFFNVLLAFIMLVMTFRTVIGEPSDEVCKTSRECGYCGYCVFTKKMKARKENQSRCLFPYEGVMYFHKKCHPKLLCGKDTCKHGGECTQGFGYSVPRCFCFNTYFYGNICDKEVYPRYSNEDYATGIAVYFNKNLKDTHLYTVDIYVTTMNSGNDLQFVVETSEGFIGRFDKKSGNCADSKVRLTPYKDERECRPEERCYLHLEDCEDVYTGRVSFPYKSPLLPSVFSVDRSMSAYEASVKITVTNMISPYRVAVFKHEYPLVIGPYSYELYSQLGVKLKHCSKLFQQRGVYFRPTPIKFSAEVEPCVADLKVVWTVWNAMWTDDVPPVAYYYNDKLVWTMEPFTLPVGNYKLQVRVSRIFKLNFLSNFAECYFEIKVQPIVAAIVGGNVRTVSLHELLVVSAESSFDPNERRSSQNHLLFSWKCETSSGRKCYNIVSSNSRRVVVPSAYLIPNKTFIYTVTVTAPGLRPASASQVVQILEFSISIQCLSNCFTKVISTEELLLGATLSKRVSLDSKFDWTYKIKHESETWLLTDSIQDKSYPSDTLCIKPDSLEGGKTYLLRVLAVYQARVLTSEIELYIARKPANGSCSVFPLSGVFADTVFNINCSGFVSDDAVLVYEYFDTNKSEEIFNGRIFSGRMLGSNFVGNLDDVKLTRGVVVVVVNTIQGYSTVFKFEIELSSRTITDTDVDNIFVTVQQSLEVGRIHSVLRKISKVSDMTVTPTSYVRSKNLYKTLVDFESKVPIKGGGDVKMGLSAIRNVIESLIGKHNHKPNVMELKETMKEKKRLSELFKINVVAGGNELYLTRYLLSELVCTFVYLVEILFDKKKNVLLTNKTEVSNVKFQILQDISILAEEIFKDITYAVSFRQDFGLKPYTVSTVSELSTISCQSDSPSKLTSQINSVDIFNSKMAPPLVKTLQAFKKLTVHTLTTKVNPFLADEYSVSTKLTSLSLYGSKNTKSDMVHLKILKQPIDVFLETTHVAFGEITLVAKQLDPNISQSVLDIKVPIVRIDLPEKCKLFIEFVLPNNKTQLRVSVKEDFRPSYESVAKSPVVVTSSSSTLDVPYDADDRRKFVYVGVLPALNTPVGDAVEFTVRFYSNLCLSRIGYQWVPKSCSVGPLTNKSVIHCRCTHLSFFAASIIIPPNKIDPFNEVYLFLTVKDNPLVLLYLLCLVVLCLVLYIWALRKDKTDSERRKLVILEDNFPCDKHLYAVAVFTGNRIFSGTDANVGIRIYGTKSRSRSHILKVTSREAFTKNTDDWFLVRTPDRLGVLKHIYIWHDNSGPCPSWYCDKILIYDLRISTVYTFFVEQWFAIEEKAYPEAVIFPATESDFRHFGRITLDNIVRELQHFHIFGRMFSSNIHNRMTRLDRVNIFNSTLFSSNLLNIAYFNVDIRIKTGVDEPSFFFSAKYIYLSTQVLILTLIISLILDAVFRNSYDSKYRKTSLKEMKVYVRPSYIQPVTPQQSKWLSLFKHDIDVDESKPTIYQHFVRILLNKSQPMKFLPVTLSKTPNANKRKHKIYTLAITISVLLIFVSFYFILLYGLKLGYEQSKIWLATLILVLAQQYILVFPLKMFVVAIVLASQFQYLSPISSYNVDVVGISYREEDNYEFYCTLIDKRSEPFYHPLSDAKVAVFRKEREQKSFLFKILQFVIVTIFLLIIPKVCNIYWSPREMYSNDHVRSVIASVAKPNMMNHPHMYNRSQLEDYLKYLFGDSEVIYNERWYNSMDSNHPQYVAVPELLTRDCVLTHVGAPILRQVRVDGVGCHFPSVFENTSLECIPVWRPDIEDTDDYDDMWTTSSWKSAKHEPTAWDHYDDATSIYHSSKGPTGTLYPCGGYVAKLNLEKRNARLNLFQLVNDHWIDQLTRVLFVEFTFYNVNRNTFSHVSLVAEQLPSGVVLTRTLGDSVRLRVFDVPWSAGFTVCLLLVFVKNILVLNHYGLFKYLLRIEAVFEVLLICLGTASVAFLIFHNIMSARYIGDFDIHNVKETFEFTKIIEYNKVSSVLTAGLFCCLAIRLLSLGWLFGQEFSDIYITLKTSTLHVTLTFFTVLVSTSLYKDITNFLLSDFSTRSASLVASFISLDKHMKPNTLELSFFLWKKFLFLLMIVLVTKKYNLAHNKPKLKPNSVKDFIVNLSWSMK